MRRWMKPNPERLLLIKRDEESGNNLGKTTLSTPDQDLSSDRPVISSCENGALDHAAIKACLERVKFKELYLSKDYKPHCGKLLKRGGIPMLTSNLKRHKWGPLYQTYWQGFSCTRCGNGPDSIALKSIIIVPALSEQSSSLLSHRYLESLLGNSSQSSPELNKNTHIRTKKLLESCSSGLHYCHCWVMIGLTAAMLVVKDSSWQKERNRFNLEVECLDINSLQHHKRETLNPHKKNSPVNESTRLQRPTNKHLTPGPDDEARKVKKCAGLTLLRVIEPEHMILAEDDPRARLEDYWLLHLSAIDIAKGALLWRHGDDPFLVFKHAMLAQNVRATKLDVLRYVGFCRTNAGYPILDVV
uniref:(California timema) hypothetical protein n=1 Tax=Timema californicum TaxID=61474 RepID=A0A7R9J216_TIMCA|nr:unnamed protein product [Timema californicum]